MNLVIVSAARTPIGKFLGGLSSLTAPQLGSYTIKEVLNRSNIDPKKVDEVIMGNTISAGVGQNPARQASIGAGIPDKIGAFTMNKVCGSGLKAIMLAAQSIKSKDNKIVVAGGMESMSNAPHILRNSRSIKKYGDIKKDELPDDVELEDSMINDSLWCAFNMCHMGSLAEDLMKKHKINREEQDEFSLSSHQKSLFAIKNGDFKNEIVSVESLNTDECPRKDTSIEKLSQLKTVFMENGTITAGNASQLSDGAAAVIVTTDKVAEKLGLTPMVEIEYYTSSAVDPKWYATAPVSGVKKLLLHLS